MIFKGKKIPFPATVRISFARLLEKLHNSAGGGTTYYPLLEQCKAIPELESGLEPSSFKQHDTIIQSLCSTIFPEPLRDNEIKGVIPPSEFRPFFMSGRLQTILEEAGTDVSFELTNFDEDQLYIYGCCSILSFYYHYPFLMTLPTLIDIPDQKTGMAKTYRVVMNGDLLDISPTEKALPISKADYEELLQDFENIALWKKKFPPESWVMQGVGVMSMFDVTLDNSLANITSRLLVDSLYNLQEILPEFRRYLNVPELAIGFLSHDNTSFVVDSAGWGNLVLGDKQRLNFKENMCEGSYQKLIKLGEPIVITDIGKWNSSDSCSVISKMISDKDFGSFIVIPIRYSQETVGYLELGSPNIFDLNGSTLLKMEVLLPTLATAIHRNIREHENRIEAIIQQECTTIHSSVKWRFEEEAIKFIHLTDNEATPVFSDIVFSDVYPLYGQLDIKSSSQKRNEAVNADLSFQLQKVVAILTGVWQSSKIPIYEELIFRVESLLVEIKDGAASGIEQRTMILLESEIHPLFEELQNSGILGAEGIADYRKLLKKGSHTIYAERGIYDRSVNTINRTLANLLDKKQKEAQQIFPHYYERYKTDGIEYNLYIGASITTKKDFSPVYLQNLQLWQLMVTWELEIEFYKCTQRLHVDYEIASLILVYSNPLSVHFRMDEKRFDVEGAYNARYEIIKKRIDKAHIKDTTERITAPGKIVIVYANDQDEVVYSRYVAFMESKGYIEKDSKEIVLLEDLQGVSGLKAMRITINYGA